MLRMFVFQNALHKVRHHLVSDQAARVGAIWRIVQIGPEVINQILLRQTQVGLGIVKQVPDFLLSAGLKMLPFGPRIFSVGIGF